MPFKLPIFVFLSFFAWMLSSAEGATLVISFDNLPIINNYILDPESKTEKYIQALSEAGITTVFFAVGREIERATPETRKCIERLVEAGHCIANHSYSHPHLSAIPVEDYLADVMHCEEWITSYVTYRPWFRYPFLDMGMDPIEGASLEKAVQCANELGARGFRHGYVTIDSFDWFITSLMIKAIEEGKQIDESALETFYVDHLRRTITRYLAAKTEGEKALFSTHVFLFHANDLNALCLPRVIEMLQAEGWTLVSPEEAFDNPENRLADFESLCFRIKQSTGKHFYLHSAEKTRREFQEQVLGEKEIY